ncbi:hypothetical protein PHMEG_00033911 [Phytophthora megakarya]|uniref:Bzip transcription factor n=1 Tax=Phytophthora megakarya TaxID=4795 RepID=A0A225US12_9STRA|nr:hypothetical protein PHMEG_00033911 [Phytophthora megakarya]
MRKYLSGSVVQARFSAEEARREELRRQRSRQHQETHKRKKRQVLTGLQSSIRVLRDEIRELETRHSSVWEVASEFFQHFQDGVKSVETQHSTAKDAEQRSFMWRVMAPDVTDGAVTGVEALLEAWRFVSQCFLHMDMKPVKLQNPAAHVLVAYTEGTVTIDEETLRLAFPHLVQHKRGSPLAAMLVGQQLVVHGSVQFEWDDARRLVTGVRWEMDLLTPLLELFGRLEDVSRVFEGALLTPDCRLSTGQAC